MLTLTVVEWAKIRKQIKEEYSWKPSILLIRDVMRRELGFVTRYQEYSQTHGTKEAIFLDFYDDAMETLFRLKYL